ncbi:MAG: tRNA pseudouridine(55) synthase TruB [Candidatus Uhrbacteria bacterium]|nr:tRNA pseudouridine(55) synthase TruB [Candidatus Uhrbacteria bacterium]
MTTIDTPQSGFLLVDKPASITSHDVIDRLRKITGIKKIGHAGTLDPFATGLLIVAVGRKATREISKFVGLGKEYEAEIVIGATTETLDSESEIIKDKKLTETSLSPSFERNGIENAMGELTGTYDQIPPMHSAIKVKGKKLYELARKGIEIERTPRKVTISAFDLIDEPKQEDGLTVIKALIKCSSGTYIRALARDLGEKIGTVAYTKNLRRTLIGEFNIKDSTALGDINAENWQNKLQSLT